MHGEPWTKTTVVLFNRQILALDRLSLDVRAKTGAVVNRAEFIRAAVEVLLAAGIDPSKIQSEADVRAAIADRLKGR